MVAGGVLSLRCVFMVGVMGCPQPKHGQEDETILIYNNNNYYYIIIIIFYFK